MTDAEIYLILAIVASLTTVVSNLLLHLRFKSKCWCGTCDISPVDDELSIDVESARAQTTTRALSDLDLDLSTVGSRMVIGVRQNNSSPISRDGIEDFRRDRTDSLHSIQKFDLSFPRTHKDKLGARISRSLGDLDDIQTIMGGQSSRSISNTISHAMKEVESGLSLSIFNKSSGARSTQTPSTDTKPPNSYRRRTVSGPKQHNSDSNEVCSSSSSPIWMGDS